MLSKRESGIIDRKARILAAAREIIARDGYEALTTRGLAEAAGVTPPTLYNLVGDKEAIVSAMALASIEELWGRLHLEDCDGPLAMADTILEKAFKQLTADVAFNRANLIALERLGIAFAYHPTRDDPGAISARRGVAMAQFACEAAIEAGQLLGRVNPLELAVQMFAVYRSALDDWLHNAIDADEMLRRQRIGFYTVLAADASVEFREELIGLIGKLTGSELAREAA